MREPAWQNHNIRAAQVGFLMPDKLGILAQHIFCRVVRVVIAIGPGKDNDGKFHRDAPSTSIRYDSITGLASSLSATSDASERAFSADSAATSSSKYLPCRTSATPL